MTVARDPTVVFCQLWDTYRFSWNINDFEDWSSAQDFDDRIAVLVQQIIDDQGVPDSLWEAVDGPFAAFELAQAVNDALETTVPTRAGRSGSRLPTVAARWAATGLLNDPAAAAGALLVRFVLPARPGPVDRVEDWFTNVIRIDPQRWPNVDHVVLTGGRHDLGTFGVGATVRVGCLPVAESLDDFLVDSVGGDYYLGPADSLRERSAIEQAVAALDSAGVDVAVLPEATIDEDSARTWSEVLAENPPDPHQRLKWILIGSGPFDADDAKPRNRAVVLDRRTGVEIAAQDKRFRFTMTADHVTDWGLDGRLPATGALAEGISLSERVTVIESLTGRHGVLICEDLSRPDGVAELAAAGASHLYVPIFAREILKYRWEQQGVDNALLHSGAFGVVSNNRAVLNARRSMGKDVSDGFTSMAHLPGDIEVNDYPALATFGLSSGPLEVVAFDLTLIA